MNIYIKRDHKSTSVRITGEDDTPLLLEGICCLIDVIARRNKTVPSIVIQRIETMMSKKNSQFYS